MIAQRSPKKIQGYFSLIFPAVFLISIFLSVLFNGSVSAPYSYATSCLVALSTCLCLMLPISSKATGKLIRTVVIILCVLSTWVVLQSLQIPLGAITHSIWAQAAETLAVQSGAISINPSQTFAALPRIILPGLVFISALILGQSATAGKRLWTSLAMLGTNVVLLAIILEVIFPNAKVFSSFEVGHGTFSGTFVNRNIAASFFGLTAFALAGCCHMAWQDVSKYPNKPKIKLATYILFLFAVLIAIIATKSRAGAMFSIPLVILGLVYATAKHNKRNGLMRALVIAGLGMILLTFYGEPVFLRLETTSNDGRWCVWQNTLAAISDNPWVGTGFATFAEAFPPFRDPVCLGTDGSWLRAHNSYFELMLGIGVPAAIILLTVVYRMLLKSCKTGIRRRRSLVSIPILTLGALTFVSAHSLVDFPLQIPGVAIYFAALMGTGCGTSILERPDRHRHRLPGQLSFQSERFNQPLNQVNNAQNHSS